MFEHLVLHVCKVVPPLLRLEVDLAQFPLPQRVSFTALEASLLLLFGNAEVELYERYAVSYKPLFEAWGVFHEGLVLFGCAEAEDRLHHRPVVPASVEKHYLAAAGELLHITLEIPLRPLLFGGLAECDYAVVLLVHIARDPPYGSAFAGSVAPFEEYDHLQSVVFEMLLKLYELRLVRLELLGLEIFPDRLLLFQQYRQRVRVAADFHIPVIFQLLYDLFLFSHESNLYTFFYCIILGLKFRRQDG